MKQKINHKKAFKKVFLELPMVDIPRDNTQEIEQKAGRGGAGTPVHSTTDEIVRGKTAIPNGVICKPQTPPSDNTQKTRHSSKTRNCEQKDNSHAETLHKKQNYPSVIEDKETISIEGVDIRDLGIKFCNFYFENVELVTKIINLYRNQGIQKAIGECQSRFNMRTETLSLKSFEEAKEKLNQEIKEHELTTRG